jgi:hypothetical protein
MQVEQELTESLAADGWIFCKTLRDVLDKAKDGDEVVLCDDNVTSGFQAICQFKSWLDVPDKDWTKEELRERGIERATLPAHHKNLLTKLHLNIITAVGSVEAKTKLSTTLHALGLTRFRGFSYGKKLSEKAVTLGGLADFLEDVGRDVIAWARFGEQNPSKLSRTQKAECKRDALGYRGAQALMCTPMNVPVGTIAAFWCPGFHKGEPWMPLLIRRGYLKHLVLA